MLPIPAGFTLRAPTMGDAPAVAQLIIECDIAESGTPDYSLEDLLQEWQLPGFDLAKDSWLIITSSGELAGYAGVWKMREANFQGAGNVKLNYLNQGLGSYMLALIEAHVGQQATVSNEPVILHNWTNEANQAASTLLLNNNYEPVRYIWRMKIELNEPPATPQFPAGITVRTFVPNQDERATYEAYEEAFADHWGHVRRSYEDWLARHATNFYFDPGIGFLAEAAGQIVGIGLCKSRAGMAEVNLLGVIPAWRGKGLGMALLQHAFGELYQRGHQEVRLGVDSQNPTGATRLYQRAGMTIERQYNRYQKKIRG